MDTQNNALPATIPNLQALNANSDAWLTSRARIVLLASESIALTDGFVEARDGVVTLKGTVGTYAEQQRAGEAVSAIDGVKGVRNFLKVMGAKPDRQKDAEIKERVEHALRKDPSLDGLKVEGVDHGVVRMTGKGVTMTGRLRAIELVWNVPGLLNEAEDGHETKQSKNPGNTAA
jgi:osmotically-inducible protein OsmY